MPNMTRPDDATLGRLVPLARSCKDCDAGFVVTTGEQTFYHAHRLELPQRCPDCRARNRARRRDRPLKPLRTSGQPARMRRADSEDM